MRNVSRRQFALPAVVFNVLDQTNLIPPVCCDIEVIRDDVIVASISKMKDSARACLDSEKAFFWARICATVGESVSPFTGLPAVFFLRGEVVGEARETSLSESRPSSCFSND